MAFDLQCRECSSVITIAIDNEWCVRKCRQCDTEYIIPSEKNKALSYEELLKMKLELEDQISTIKKEDNLILTESFFNHIPPPPEIPATKSVKSSKEHEKETNKLSLIIFAVLSTGFIISLLLLLIFDCNSFIQKSLYLFNSTYTQAVFVWLASRIIKLDQAFILLFIALFLSGIVGFIPVVGGVFSLVALVIFITYLTGIGNWKDVLWLLFVSNIVQLLLAAVFVETIVEIS